MPHIVALHGLPTSPAIWARLPVSLAAPALRGLSTPAAREDYSLGGFVREVLPLVDGDTVLIGHDLGGVIAAMAAVVRRPRALVLCGTALGPYWAPVRATAWPGLAGFFYDRYGGRRFLAGAVSAERREEVLEAFDPARVPDLPARMRAVAAAMRPPAGLARALRGVPTALLWGEEDRWYPDVVARAVSRGTGAPLSRVPGGHLCMWERPDAWAAGLRAALRALRV